MSVGTFEQPDFESQTGTEYKTAIDNSISVLHRIGGLFAPHSQATSDMTVRLDPGAIFNNSILTEVALQNMSFTAPTTNNRVDRIVISNTSGTGLVVKGTPATVATAPSISYGYSPICKVSLATSTTAITNSLITDERILGGTGSANPFPINGIYYNLGIDPATELDYGTWQSLGYVDAIHIPLYPVAQSATYVKATSTLSANHYPYFATDPAKALTGAASGNDWMSADGADQRFHVDFGSPQIIRGIYYEPYHDSGGDLTQAAKAFTLQGAPDTGNGATAFAELTYATDTYWSDLTADIAEFVQHIAADRVDPHFVLVPNIISYRYAAVKISTNWGGNYNAFRRIVFLTSPIGWLRTA